MGGKLIDGERISRTIRGITPETFQLWSYQTGTHRGEPVHIANHLKMGRPVGQKIRTRSKSFMVKGELEPLYGMWLWSSNNAKRCIVTEGELDALSVSQAQNNRWPVVSVPNGAQGAGKAVAKASEWLSGFSEVVLMFDNDEAGREAAVECAQILPPGKAKIATLRDAKDANELLVEGKEHEILQAIYNAEYYRPDGIVNLKDVIADALKPPEWGDSLPWETLTDLTYGTRTGEWWCWGAGVGVGKTDVFTQLMAHDVTEGRKIGGIFLEQPAGETAKRLAGKIDGVLYHVPDIEVDEEQLEATLHRIADQVYLYQHFGSQDWETIKGLIRHMRHAYDIRHFYLDHLTALASHAEDERRYLDKLCAEMSSLCQELDIHVQVVSHLTTPQGEAHEEGGRVKEKHFTGSRAIARWAFFMFGLERNKQHEDEAERHITTVRVLKDRNTGRGTGKTFRLGYDPNTGQLFEAPDSTTEVFNDEDIGF